MSTIADQVIGLRTEKAQLIDQRSALDARIDEIDAELDAIATALTDAPSAARKARKGPARAVRAAKRPETRGGRTGRPRHALPEWMDRVRAALTKAGGPMSPKQILAATGLQPYQFRRASQELHRTKTVTSSGSTKLRVLALA